MVLVLVVALFAGCGGGQEEPEEKEETTAKEDTTEAAEEKEEMEEDSDGVTITIYQNKVEITEPLTAFGEIYQAETGVQVDVKSAGGGTSYADSLIAAFQTKNQPDIFVIEGMGGYEIYKDQIVPFEDDEWIDLTDLEFVVDGSVYGFPVAVEGLGHGIQCGHA